MSDNSQYRRTSGKTSGNGSYPLPLKRGEVSSILKAANNYQLRDGIPSPFRRKRQ